MKVEIDVDGDDARILAAVAHEHFYSFLYGGSDTRPRLELDRAERWLKIRTAFEKVYTQ